MKIFYLIYLSSATELFSESDLNLLLNESRDLNSRNGITGMLLYKAGSFMQLIEGEKEKVLDLLAKIEIDKRHHKLQVLLKGEEDQRQFPNWSMAFKNLDRSLEQMPEGFSDFLTQTDSSDSVWANPTRCQKLLLSFKNTMQFV